MAQKIIAGVTVDVTEEGYLTDPSQWTKEIALEIAKEEGLELTEKHFAILDYLREKQRKVKRLRSGQLVIQALLTSKDFTASFRELP